MPETQAIVGIFGAVDRAVQADPVARLETSRLLSGYRDPNLHWYDEFQEWLSETAGGEAAEAAGGEGAEESEEQAAVKLLHESLSQLADTPEPPRGRILARRMFAIEVAARAFPQMRHPESELRRLAVEALRTASDGAPKPKAKQVEARADDLFELLAAGGPPLHPDETLLPGTRRSWKALVATASDAQLIPNKVGMFPRPCTGRLMTVPGIEGPVAVIQTQFRTDEGDFDRQIKFKDATNFIEPVNWKTCMGDFWCQMETTSKESGGRRTYHEIVSTHCGEKAAPGFWAETELLFNFMWVPDETNPEAAVANYQLAKGRPLKNDRIRLDEGSLVVAKIKDSDALRVTTTKRVNFSDRFTTLQTAAIVCALGYADATAGLMTCAASRGVRFTGTPFPGAPATSAFSTRRAGSAGLAGSQAGGGETRLTELFQDSVDIWARCVREGVSALERGLGSERQAGARKKQGRPGS